VRAKDNKRTLEVQRVSATKIPSQNNYPSIEGKNQKTENRKVEIEMPKILRMENV
jgi:hypothetical protein